MNTVVSRSREIRAKQISELVEDYWLFNVYESVRCVSIDSGNI